MGKNIDLHMHSLYSDDGELSPEDIIKIGKKEGMDIMALTDHNSVKGVDEMIKHGEEAGIRIISGVEIDCVYKGINLHMLGYGINYKRKEFIEIEEEIFKKEIAIARTKIEKLKENTNLIVDEEKIFEIANGKIVTGEIIGEVVLTEKQNRNNFLLREYFNNGAKSDMPFVHFYWDFFSQGKIAYVPIEFRDMSEIITLIKDSGGLAVLAHPGNNFKDCLEVVDDIIKERIDGIEVFSTYHSPEQIDYFYERAKANNLLLTFGSDFHGKNKPNIRLKGYPIPKKYKEMKEKLVGDFIEKLK
ncbi:PHP domain-containing protein [Fusobacterium varium]|uniref:PHP domain-containing protein n=1 Tax=Fusobacterium varium TaxID=856 RepID=UPI001F242DD3|nr:PHP domain-containing protein [Fusobacterium varium]MCF2672221.1 PHP domain-containing protein [Fusobacterium varium]